MYHFFLLCVFGCIGWILLFAITCDLPLRREMLVASIIGLMGGWFSPFYTGRYWNPEILYSFRILGVGFDIESFIFGFTLMGIAAGMTSRILGRTLTLYDARSYLHFLPFIVLYPWVVFAGGVVIVPEAVIRITFLTYGIILMTVFVIRRDLVIPGLVGETLFCVPYCLALGTSFLIFPVFSQAWISSVLTGITLVTIPIEEVIFAFLFGGIAAVSYKFCCGYTMAE